ncbi:MAG: type II secretion system minor pseudopilin GspI [Dokdonella sp.]|uniref:type II secretion system minor pseudopilin GspI n=1 Tax=Dokdonella sp. TaxID=2291710 RepID=UPI0025BF8071|nr:type II secretion system minor pseudopilin GspI [Dokdonella sp.]MBZ0224348.1 type II secretion system minor pseudopilin GspI [Dokdonella sp.]
MSAGIRQRRDAGFTLIEVLIALVVVAVALLALSRAASVQISNFDALRERTLAGWVAANVLADARIAPERPTPGRSDGRVELAGRAWRWQREVSAIPQSEILRIEVRVFHGDDKDPSASLNGFRGFEP